MPDRQSAPDPDPLPLVDAQLGYWEAWLKMVRKGLGNGSDAAGKPIPPPWSETLKQPWDAVVPTGSAANGSNFDHFIPLGQAYNLFGEQAVKIIECLDESARLGADWRSGIHKGIHRIRASYFTAFDNPDPAHPRLAALWGLPLSSWQQVANCGPISILDPGVVVPPSITSATAPSLDTEWQQRACRSARLWRQYQDAHRVYAALVHRAADSSLDRLQTRLIERGEAQQPITTLRDLYNLWVDCADEAYLEMIHGEEYSQAQGRMINTLMRARRYGQDLFSDILAALRIPNRAELDAIHTRLVETCRRFIELNSTSPVGSRPDRPSRLLEEFEAQLDALRQVLRTIKAEIASAANSGKSNG